MNLDLTFVCCNSQASSTSCYDFRVECARTSRKVGLENPSY